MAEVQKKPALITPMGRLSYPNLFRARAVQQGGEPMFSCTVIFDEAAQKTKEYQALKAAASQAAKDFKWPGGKIPANMRSPFRDGADKDSEGYGPGKVFINISSKQRPGVVGVVKDPVTGKPMVLEDESEVYAGCYVKASVRPYAYSNKGNNGVSFGLQNIQKVRDGDPLGNRSRAEDDFSSVESEEGDNEESADELFQ